MCNVQKIHNIIYALSLQILDDSKDGEILGEKEKENEGPVKHEPESGKPDSTTAPALNEPEADGRRTSGPGSRDGRRLREVCNISILRSSYAIKLHAYTPISC